MVDVRLDTKGVAPPFKVKVMGNELSLMLILIDDPGLPGKVVGHQLPLVLSKLTGQTAIDCPVHRRKVLPGVNPVRPVVKTKVVVKLL